MNVMGIGDSISFEIQSTSPLEAVFLHFLDKFQSLPSPRSIAEARITVKELDDLARWLYENSKMARVWCESIWQDDLVGGISASRQEMIGALLLIMASEVCRDKSNEDSVWPAVTEVFKSDKSALSALFVRGQPSSGCKAAIAAGARKLDLRNLLDRDGQQEYFDTIKLQFGFTLKGASRRLPEWLDRLGTPIAVRILVGRESECTDLKSVSFSAMWKTLVYFRKGEISAEQADATLNTSPWIRPQWIPELLRVSGLRPTREFYPSTAVDNIDNSTESICEPILRWEIHSKPRLLLQLNEERVLEILGDSDRAAFDIDGRVVDRWMITQEEGGWRGRRELPCEPEGTNPNLHPKLLSISSDGKLLEEVDLVEIGMGEPLLIFDLRRGVVVDPTSQLDRGRDYGFVCDGDIQMESAGQPLKLKDRVAYRLSSPWENDPIARSDGTLYWLARVDDKEPLQPIRMTLESPVGESTEIGSPSMINVNGAPEGGVVVSLSVGNSVYPATQHVGFWQTVRPVKVTLGMALGHDRVRVRVEGKDYARTVSPRLSLGLRGVAYVETDADLGGEPQWKLLNRQHPLNRADGTGKALIFAGTSDPQLFEGNRFLGKVTSRALPLRDTYGWGAPLIVRSERVPEVILVESVEDFGLAHFLPPLFSGITKAKVSWRSSHPPSLEHRILVWTDMTQDPRELGAAAVSSQKNDRIWELPELGSMSAMAIAYRGTRIASHWISEPIIRALRKSPSAKLFGYVRWLKIPVLNQSFRAPMQEAVAIAPVEFVKGWSGTQGLRSGLVHREAEEGDILVREFLWNYSERNESKMEQLARAFPKPLETEHKQEAELDVFKLSLARLGGVCPSLAYNLARSKISGNKFQRLVRAAAASIMGQPATTDLQQLQPHLMAARYECAKLIGISSETLEESVRAYEAHLGHRESSYQQFELNLRKLGERSRGRQFLTSSLLVRLVERARS